MGNSHKLCRKLEEFHAALEEKLNRADEKYNYGDSWSYNDWEEKCREDLHKHIKKGDPLDVAAYCFFMWYHNWSTND